ncbi:MAG: Bro-N domain-containing protein [Eubacteriales bacterium]|nr:Bro-N domain-containing protein [Eubacteriales bacterium]
MNEMQIFSNETYGEIRTMVRDSMPWFVAADVCRVLGLDNNRQALTRLDDDEKDVISNDTLGGKQQMSIINEPGLYSLVLGSRKPEARTFRRWITHEVLPAIRKYGAYAADPETMALLAETAKRLKADNDRLHQQLNWANSREGRKAARAPEAKLLPEKCCEGFLESIAAMLRDGEAEVLSPFAPEAKTPGEDVIGYIDCQYLYLLPTRTFERIYAQREKYGEIFPVTPRILYKMLREGGYVRCEARGRATRAKSIGGKIMRMLWVPRELINEK